MENPATRPKIAQFIDEEIRRYQIDISKGVIGWSLAMRIYDALKREGYLKEE